MVFPSFLLHHLSIASLPPALIWFPSQLPSWAVRLPRAGRGRSFFLNIQMAKGALSGWVVQLALRETNLPTSTSEQFQSCWLPHPPDIPFPLLSSPQTPCFPPPAPDHFSTSPYTNSTLKEALSCLWALGLLLGSLPFFLRLLHHCGHSLGIRLLAPSLFLSIPPHVATSPGASCLRSAALSPFPAAAPLPALRCISSLLPLLPLLLSRSSSSSPPSAQRALCLSQPPRTRSHGRHQNGHFR